MERKVKETKINGELISIEVLIYKKEFENIIREALEKNEAMNLEDLSLVALGIGVDDDKIVDRIVFEFKPIK